MISRISYRYELISKAHKAHALSDAVQGSFNRGKILERGEFAWLYSFVVGVTLREVSRLFWRGVAWNIENLEPKIGHRETVQALKRLF
jgi:hypothetical protein